MENDTPFVSVVVPVYNDPGRLTIVLEGLEAQTYPRDRYEVVVVDNASDVAPEAVVANFSQAKLESESKRGSYAARNHGLAVAAGNVLAFTDADCIIPPSWLKAGVKALAAIGWQGLIAGDIRLRFKRPGRPNAAEVYDLIRGFNAEACAEQGFAYTGNAFTHRSVFDQVGEFDSDLLSRGDFEWGKRVAAAGLPVVYSAEAWIEHPSRHRLRQVLMKERRLQAGRLRMLDEETVDPDPPGSRSIPWWTRIFPSYSAISEYLRDKRLSTTWRRLRFVAVASLVHYVRGLERVRLKLGGSAERR